LDGIISYGESFSASDLSLGSHTIYLNATDSSNLDLIVTKPNGLFMGSLLL